METIFRKQDSKLLPRVCVAGLRCDHDARSVKAAAAVQSVQGGELPTHGARYPGSISFRRPSCTTLQRLIAIALRRKSAANNNAEVCRVDHIS